MIAAAGLRAHVLIVMALLAFVATGAQAAVDISSKPTKNMNCSAGVCTPTAKSAVLNVDHLVHLLKTSDVKVTTGSGAVTIEVTSALSWATASRLTLDANCNVSIKAPVTVAGTGAMTIVTNDGGSGCDLLFFPGGKVDFWDLGSSLVVNGSSYVLAADIKTLADDITANASGFFALSADYDAEKDGTYTKSPVQTALQGGFEGLGHTLTNLTINATGNAGLFQLVSTTATLRDVNIADAKVTCASAIQQSDVGILAARNDGLIANASAGGSVAGSPAGKRRVIAIGGLVGVNTGTIRDSSAAATVAASRNGIIGGLVGYSPDGVILRSHATGNVSGGLYSSAGGLAGYSLAVAESYATASVSVTERGNLGGLVGLGYVIYNSFALGSVQGGKGSVAGGLAGYGGEMGSSYSLGSVESHGPKSLTGGLIGDHEGGSFSDTYWDLDTSGIGDQSEGAGNIPNDPGITGLTDAQLKSGLPAGFDPAIWGQDSSVNNGYPYLLANPPAN